MAPIFEEYVAKVGVADRLAFQPGSFFTDPLPTSDVVLMGHILHDWDLPTKQMLVAKAFDALPVGGALVVYEAIETPAGFDYTGADCASWMKAAGFSSTRVEPLLGPDSMVIGIR